MSARSLRRLVGTGVLATLAAVVATTVVATVMGAAGIGFEVPVGGETIPLSGIAFVTGVLSLVGVGIAVGLLRWSGRPDVLFVRSTVALTFLSLVPPWLVGAAASTSVALVVLHLVAAVMMIPSLVWSLRIVGPSPSAARVAPDERRGTSRVSPTG